MKPVMWSKVSQKWKNNYRVSTERYGIQKNGTDKPTRRQGVEMQTKRTDMWAHWGKEVVGQTEKVALTYIHHHV